MSFQNTVYNEQNIGVAGCVSRSLATQHLPKMAEGSEVKKGGFVFAGTSADQVKGVSVGATSVEGFAIFERYQAPFGSDYNSMKVNEGEEIEVLKKGYAFCVSETAAVRGYIVGVDPSTGVIKAVANAGALPSATAGKVTFASVDYNDFSAISSGTLTINVDGTVSTVSSIDLHSAASLSDIASALDTAIGSLGVGVSTSSTSLVFTSDTTGSNSKVQILGGTVGDIILTSSATAVDGLGAFIDTGFKVETAAAAGAVCEIYNI